VGQTTVWGNGIANGDPKNNVEQATVSLAGVVPSGTGPSVTVTVIGAAVPQPPQRFALVVSGPLNMPSIDSGAPDGGGAVIGIGGGNRDGSNLLETESGDAVALGLAVPLLLLAVAGGGCFAFRRSGPPPTSGKPGGVQLNKTLPPGWRQHVDPSSGAPYYLNESTGQTQWEPPALQMVPPPPPPPPGAPPLPPNWISATDPASGRVYYYNTATGESSWVLP